MLKVQAWMGNLGKLGPWGNSGVGHRILAKLMESDRYAQKS